MAVKGLAAAIAARYTTDGYGNVTYTGGRRFAKAIEFTVDYGDKKGNDLYADNAVAETSSTFSGGTLTLKTDDLDAEASRLLLNLQEREAQYNGKSVKVLYNTSDDSSPYLGLGLVIQKQMDGVTSHVATILPKVAFSIPSDSAKTKGESIEWQTPSIPGKVMRADSPDHCWKMQASFPTEAGAIEYIKYFLGMLPSALRVTSTAGSVANTTTISVTPVKPAGSSYKYLLGDEVYAPDKGAPVPDAYSAWDGAAAIEARPDQKILVVEVDAQGKVQKAGTTEVTVKG